MIHPRSSLAAGLAAALLLAVTATAEARVFVGSPGGDHLRGTSAKGDTLWGGGGTDTLIGGSGPDKLYGVRSNNKIFGRGGDDYIEGGAGSDLIDGGSGNNTIFGSSGHDQISVGNGNNYVDVGGAFDEARLGDGDNILVTGSGGGRYTLGKGNNTIYYGSGIAYLRAGSGVNTFYLAGTRGLRRLDCGGNPASVVYVNTATLKKFSLRILKRKTKGCPTIATYAGGARARTRMVGRWQAFALVGGPGRDKLFGGHGGGTIDAGEGDNEVWADRNEDTGLPRSARYTTRITAGGGNNRIFGGRGTNLISLGDGNNFVRAGVTRNEITVGSGENLIRLQGRRSVNKVVIRGRGEGTGSFVESLANGKRPEIKCVSGAKAAIVYGNTRPRSNCRPMYSARSKRGQELQVEKTPGVPGSDPMVDGQIEPGENGHGVPRPNGE